MTQQTKGRKPGATSGYLTVYVALTLTVMVSLCLVLIEGVRRHTIAFESECVMDIGMDSVLAEYHRVLLERYGLLMVDTSYGTDYPSYYNTPISVILQSLRFTNQAFLSGICLILAGLK